MIKLPVVFSVTPITEQQVSGSMFVILLTWIVSSNNGQYKFYILNNNFVLVYAAYFTQ
jgi:hypothetical protein